MSSDFDGFSFVPVSGETTTINTVLEIKRWVHLHKYFCVIFSLTEKRAFSSDKGRAVWEEPHQWCLWVKKMLTQPIIWGFEMWGEGKQNALGDYFNNMLSHTLVPVSKTVTQKGIKEGKERFSQRTILKCLTAGFHGSIPPIALPNSSPWMHLVSQTNKQTYRQNFILP